MLRFNSIVTSKASSNRREGHANCCKYKAALVSAASGVIAAAKCFGEDNNPVTIHEEPSADLGYQNIIAQALPLPKPQPCKVRAWLGWAQTGSQIRACPFSDPVRWSLQKREKGAYAIAHLRHWLANDMSASPGVFAASGAVSTLPVVFAAVPAPALWFAGVSLFTLGAIDVFVRQTVQRRAREEAARIAALEQQKAMELNSGTNAWPELSASTLFQVAAQPIFVAASTAAISMLSRGIMTAAPVTAKTASASSAAAAAANSPQLQLLEASRYFSTVRFPTTLAP
jgi:hypothetical protein